MTSKRDIIFISHANPEDNLFAFWLATRLSLYGYNVWCDVREFSGGEYMWDEINRVLENEASKFIFVLSKDSVHKRGSLNELAKAIAVASKYSDELKNFIIPIRLDDFNYLDSRPELINIFTIEFCRRWASGLNELVSKLEKEGVTKKGGIDHQEWFNQIFNQYFNTALSEKEEDILTNWFPIISSNNLIVMKTEPKAVKKFDGYPYPIVRQGDYLISLSDINELQKTFPIIDYEIKTETDFIKSEKGILFKGIQISRDLPNRIYIELLNQALNKELSKRANKYELSQSSCFYYTTKEIPDLTIKIEPYHKRPKKIIGNHKGNYWHFAISGFARLFPIKAFTIKSHILFSSDGINLYEDNKRQHRLRRQMSRNRFNNFWLNGLLNIVYNLSNEGKIQLNVGNEIPLEISVNSVKLNSEKGLNEEKIKRFETEEIEEIDNEE